MTACLVSPEVLVDVRRWADEAATLAGPGDEYVATCRAAVVDTLDWAQGDRASTPVSGEVLEPTRAHLERESARALDQETALRRVRERSTYPGKVRETLEFLLGRADAPF